MSARGYYKGEVSAPEESRQQFANRRLSLLRKESNRFTFQHLLEFFRHAGEIYDKGERA